MHRSTVRHKYRTRISSQRSAAHANISTLLQPLCKLVAKTECIETGEWLLLKRGACCALWHDALWTRLQAQAPGPLRACAYSAAALADCTPPCGSTSCCGRRTRSLR